MLLDPKTLTEEEQAKHDEYLAEYMQNVCPVCTLTPCECTLTEEGSSELKQGRLI